MKKTSILSIRINDDEKEILNTESELQGITLNALIGQILSKHIRWDRYSRDIGHVFISKPFLRSLLKNIDNKHMEKIGLPLAVSSMREEVLFSKGDITIENFLSVFDMWLNSCNIPFRHIAEGELDKYIIKHDLGINFSTYLRKLVENTLNEIQFKFTEINNSEDNITFELQCGNR